MAPSLSPSALKKRRQRARRSSERKEEAKKVDRERKQLKRANESSEKLDEQRQANTKRMRVTRKHESPDKLDEQRQANTKRMRVTRKHESPDKLDEQRQANRERMQVSRKRALPEKRDEERQTDKERKQKKRREDTCRPLSFESTEVPSVTMKEAIARAMKEAKEVLQRTKDQYNGSRHKANVCIICECFIFGTDSIKYLKPKDIKKHTHRIGVKSYERYYKTKLHPDLVDQYHVPGLPGLLLSPLSRKTDKGYITCSACYTGMQSSCIKKNSPPKLSIANGFTVGSIPSVISFKNKNGQEERRHINVEEDVSDVLRAYLATTRPYGYIFAYTGGSHKSISGHYQYFEMDQSHVGGVMNYLDPEGVGKTIFCMICGRMTPKQKEIVRKRTAIDTKMYMDLLSWFIQNGHPGYEDLPLPQDIPSPIVIEDKDSTNNTDSAVNRAVEETFSGGTYFFSSAQEPSESTSVYGSKRNFALAMMNRSAPTLLAVGGKFEKSNEVKVENILPFAFPYGIGGPDTNRR